ncbi:MAG: glycosyltransferase family 2 protein [Gemmatimonadota bacterium]
MTSTRPATGISCESRFRREIALTLLALGVTMVAAVMLGSDVGGTLRDRIRGGGAWGIAEQGIFIAIVYFLIYGNLVYQVARLGSLVRSRAHRPASREALERLYDAPAPWLTVLVPSYREEERVIWQTLLSAALMEYPRKSIVLLIDDSPNPSTPEAARGLAAARDLPQRLSALLAPLAKGFTDAGDRYFARKEGGTCENVAECHALAAHYDEAARWLEEFADGAPRFDHSDDLVIARILRDPAALHRERAAELRRSATGTGRSLSPADLDREYRRLATLFRTDITSFERKGYTNLSHEANKAMNLNAYIGLMGGRFKKVRQADGLHLVPTTEAEADLEVPAAELLITLDADSALLNDYALRLIHEMRKPGRERLAVIQTPYSAFPGATSRLERLAGSTTDVQHIVHQGFTWCAGTYWVGANALIRRAALDEIAVPGVERGYPVIRFIQDRTVIEDTESSIDLIERGWSLYNYPNRLAYSATPPDFGALVIQRRRWANGGLIILPKLLRHILGRALPFVRPQEAFVRTHYLTSLAGGSLGVLLLILYPFEEAMRSFWLPLTALPYFALYARDQALSGYSWTDVFRVYALNLLLIPVHLAGVGMSLRQAMTGRKTPFGRTPKIASRTFVQALYLLAPIGLLVYCFVNSIVDLFFGRWAHSAFAAFNGAFLAYAMTHLVGIKETREDLRLAWTSLRRAATERRPPPRTLAESPIPTRASILLRSRGFREGAPQKAARKSRSP